MYEPATQEPVQIADTVWTQSHLLSAFVGYPCEARRNNRSIYRWLVSMDDVMADPVLRDIYSNEPPGFMAWIDPGTKMLWTTYRCRGGKMLNIALGHKTQPFQVVESVWHAPVSREEVLSTAENYHPSIKKMVSMANEDGIHIHHVSTRAPLDSFVRGRTVVVGDAAHVMMSTHAAGAGIAIESAASLEVLFREVNGKDGPTIRCRLNLFDKLRIPRCNLTMLASNSEMGRLQQPGAVDEIRRFYHGPLPPPDALPYSEAWRQVLFHHDEYRAAEERLAQASSQKSTLAEGG
jgi:salicylate hydroxylase